MGVPDTNFDVPFNVTRASHIVLLVRDLENSLKFYAGVIGLVVTEMREGVAYLRGVEESAHHSLVLKQTDGVPCCERVGFRMLRDQDLRAAKAYFDGRAIPAEFVETAHQGLTLHVRDHAGIPLEFCASMPAQQRIHDQFHLQHGAAALRLDHFQLLTPNVAAASEFYAEIGFRISDWFTDGPEDTEPLGVFLYRKHNPHDVVLLKRYGPLMHHFAYVVTDSSYFFRCLDDAMSLGFGSCLERGPGRHGEGHVLYVYMRDPDGHRVEIHPPAISLGDIDDIPRRWHRGNRHSWEFPAPKTWLYEGSTFKDVPVAPGKVNHGLASLEDFLATKRAPKFPPGAEV